MTPEELAKALAISCYTLDPDCETWDDTSDAYKKEITELATHFLTLYTVTPIDPAKGWQPIETAPKDGSHVLLYRPEIQFIGYYGGDNSGWRINAPLLPSMFPIPTHWMPVPKPPEVKP